MEEFLTTLLLRHRLNARPLEYAHDPAAWTTSNDQSDDTHHDHTHHDDTHHAANDPDQSDDEPPPF